MPHLKIVFRKGGVIETLPFERNRNEYYERLLAISRDDDWTGWCVFFLKAIQIQALENPYGHDYAEGLPF